jgi:DNA-directed RNA polymerase specialized sigma24 family protein
MKRNAIIQELTETNKYKNICEAVISTHTNLSKDLAEDLFHEAIIEIIEMPEERLPELKGLNFYFYCLARNLSSERGRFGKLINQKTVDVPHLQDNEYQTEVRIREAETFMLNLTEFENRIVLLYNELGNMKAVQRATGISYSALRAVKNKLCGR